MIFEHLATGTIKKCFKIICKKVFLEIELTIIVLVARVWGLIPNCIYHEYIHAHSIKFLAMATFKGYLQAC